MEHDINQLKKLAKKMGSPWSSELEKIIKTLYTPEEIEILLVFNGPYMDRFTVAKIAKKVERPVEEVEPILKEMARTQRVFAVEKDNVNTYSLFPMVPGLFELYFANHKRAKQEEEDNMMVFAEEYEKYYDKGYIVKGMTSSYPLMRVFVDQKVVKDTVSRGKGTIIEVQEEVDEVKNIILPFDQAKIIVENSRRFSVMDCACRIHMKIHNNGVPVNEYPFNVCMAFNANADYVIQQGVGREVTKEEALETLTAAAKAGLVHTTQNIIGQPWFTCNCDRDTCIMLRGIRQFHNPNTVASSNFIPEYDIDQCIFCQKCTKLCPMYTIELVDEDTDNKRIEINLDR
ncbi:MAG: hypothetical protein ACTSPS_19915, partial [Promethearchaeota archaeon]